MDAGFAEGIGARLIRVLAIGAFVILATGAGCGFLIAKLVR